VFVVQQVERPEQHAHERGLRAAGPGGLDEVVLPAVVVLAAAEIEDAQEQEAEERRDHRDVGPEAELEHHVRVRHAHDHGDDDAGDCRLHGQPALEIGEALEQRDLGRAGRRSALAAERLELVLEQLRLGDLEIRLFVAHDRVITRRCEAAADNLRRHRRRAAADRAVCRGRAARTRSRRGGGECTCRRDQARLASDPAPARRRGPPGERVSLAIRGQR
jgi:hypothetical protein